MTQKLFSLMYGDNKEIVANRKIIPAKEFSQLIDARDLMEKVKQDAETYKLEVAVECEKLKEYAQQEGFAEGYQVWVEQVAKLEEEIINVRQELKKMLIPAALKAAKKIVGREIELSEDTIVDIVSNQLKAVAQHSKVIIYVNKRDFEAVENSRQRLKDVFEHLESLSIRERSDIGRGGCVIETEMGIINAQLENQWSALERAFALLMKQPSNETKNASKTDSKSTPEGI